MSLGVADKPEANDDGPKGKDNHPAASTCDSKIASQVENSQSFRLCNAQTGLSLGDQLKKKDDLDPTRASFCKSSACLDVFKQLQSLGGLSCLAPYSTALLPLDQAAGGVACFGAAAFAPPPAPTTAPPLTAPPTVATTPLPTPSFEAGSRINASDGSLGHTVAVTAPVESNHKEQQTAPPINVAQPDASSKRSTTNSVILWLLVVTSSFMVVVFSLACFVFYRRSANEAPESEEGSDVYVKQAKSTREQRAASKTQELSTDSESPTAQFPSHKIMISSSTFDMLDDCADETIHSSRLPYEKLVFGELLSQGSFGEVYHGTYHNETVAIKTLLRTHRKNAHHIQNLLHEVQLLATLEHERIVRFIGVAWDSWSELCVVMEFCEGGDLRSLLQAYEKRGDCQGFDASKVQIALHIAHGLMYLHTLQPIVLHRDLKSRNVLLDANLNAKITDFGVSRETSDETMTAGVGSCLWMAPEVVMGDRYDEKADIFSFGVLLSELDLYCLPYSHARASQTDGHRLPDTTIVQLVSMGLLSVAFSDEEQSAVAQLGRDCVALDADARPPASEVLHRLHEIYQRFMAPTSGAFV